MEAAICTLVSLLQTFAGKDGSSSTLSKEEFHNLVTSQLPNFVKVDFKAQSQPNSVVNLTFIQNDSEGVPSVRNRFISRLSYADCSLFQQM